MKRWRVALTALILALCTCSICPAQRIFGSGAGQKSPISPERVAFVAYRAALADFDARKPKKAEGHLQDALRAAPGWTDALNLLGFLAEVTKRPNKAAEYYRQALEREPKDVFASHALKALAASRPGLAGGTGGGEVEPQGGEGAAQAYQVYRDALEVLLSHGQDPPLSAVSAAAKALPSWPDAHLLLGYCRELGESRAEAINAYKNALHFAPEDLHALQALVNVGYLPAALGNRPTDTDAADLEQLMVDLINEERVRRRLKRLTVNQTLVKVARLHSAEMRDLQYFSHQSPTPQRRELRQRYNLVAEDRPRMLGENIARRHGIPSVLTPAKVRGSHGTLMQSPPHRANILHEDFREVGVGFAINDRGDYWVTQVFMRK